MNDLARRSQNDRPYAEAASACPSRAAFESRCHVRRTRSRNSLCASRDDFAIGIGALSNVGRSSAELQITDCLIDARLPEAITYGHRSQKPSTPPLSVKYQHSFGAWCFACPCRSRLAIDVSDCHAGSNGATPWPPVGGWPGPVLARGAAVRAIDEPHGIGVEAGSLDNHRRLLQCQVRHGVRSVRGAPATGMQAAAIVTAAAKVPQAFHPRIQYRVFMAASIAAFRSAHVRRLQVGAGDLLRASGLGRVTYGQDHPAEIYQPIGASTEISGRALPMA